MSMAYFKIYSTISVDLSRIIYVSGFNRCWIHVVLVWHVLWKTNSCTVWISLLILMDVSLAEQHEFRKCYKKFTLFGGNFFQMHLGKVGFGELARVRISWSKACSNLGLCRLCVQKSWRRASFDYSVLLRIHENRVILCPEWLLIQNYKLIK